MNLMNFKIFEQLSRQDIDPYGEEDWNDDNDTPIITLAKKQNKPLDQITHLSCSDKSLTSLEGIEHLTKLRILNCSDNRLTNLEGIEHLTNLKSLYCYNNQLTNLEGIEHLTNLETLYCSNNKFNFMYKFYLKTLKINDLKI